ncbi:MAG: hypothetical protein H8E40_03700 [Chloroflexi bacterium]|nr:hypothetical protein [Chloroflexota bacterium]
MSKVERFVYIVESPSDEELMNGVGEGRMLCDALRLAGVTSFYRLAVSRTAFEKALGEGIDYAMGQMKEHIPIVHISAHGTKRGICLTCPYSALGTFTDRLEWGELAALLAPINSAAGGRLDLCMSSCGGGYGVMMALERCAGMPFRRFVGSLGKPTWADTAIGFGTFYHLFVGKGKSFDSAVEAMASATGHMRFRSGYAGQLRRDAVKLVRQARREARGA